MKNWKMAIAVIMMIGCLMAYGCDVAKDNADLILKARNVRAAKIAAEDLLAANLVNEAKLVAKIEDMPEGEDRDEALRLLSQVKADNVGVKSRIAQMDETLAMVKRAMDASNADIEAVEGVVDTAAPFAGPWSGLVTGLAGLFLGLWRSNRIKRTALAVIRSVDDVVKPTVEETAKIAREQGKAGSDLVDEAQGKRKGLPF